MDWRIHFSSQHIPADVDLEDEYNDLARPSFIGSASELTILTCCISEQQCWMEIDSGLRVCLQPDELFFFFFHHVLC